MSAGDPHAPLIDSFIETVMLVILGVVAAVMALPVLLTAAPMAVLIELRGWRRWPTVVTGVCCTTLAICTGAWESYWRGWFGVIPSTLRNQTPVGSVIRILPFALAAGLLTGPLLARVWERANRSPACVDDRSLSAQQLRRTERLVARLVWPTPENRTVLGLAIGDSPPEWTVRKRGHQLVAPSIELWGRHALILGETGSGKTITALSIASEALRVGWSVYFIDAKADPETADQFLSAALAAGVEARNGLVDPPDGWRGGSDAIINRLLATQNFTEPYYEGVARSLLQRAVSEQTRSLIDVIHRLAEPIPIFGRSGPRPIADDLPQREVIGVRARYEAIAWAIGDHLDGKWSYEDTRAAYVPVGRPEHRNQAAEIGAFILEDLYHWALARKPRHQRALVIIDEFSKMSDRPDAAVDLIERARSYGAGTILIAQSWDSLGPTESHRNRLAATVGTIICHQLKQPEPVAALAGTSIAVELTEQLLDGRATGLGSKRAGNRFTVHPDLVRRLHRGHAYLIAGGNTAGVHVRSLNVKGTARHRTPDHA